MMSAALVHLLVEANEALEKSRGAAGENGREHFPWANALCGVGFIFTLIAAQFLETDTDERQCLDCSTECNFSRSLNISPGASILSKGLSEPHSFSIPPPSLAASSLSPAHLDSG